MDRVLVEAQEGDIEEEGSPRSELDHLEVDVDHSVDLVVAVGFEVDEEILGSWKDL